VSAGVVARESHIPVASGIVLHVEEWGDAEGVPVLLLHGGGQSARVLSEVCRRLPAALRCIVPDQRGHGGSDRAPDGDYSCDAQAADAAALLAALGIRSCALVGHSMGGLNALRLAGDRPGLARALVLIDVGTETREAALDRLAARPARPASEAAGFDTRLLEFVPTYCGDAEERRRLLRSARAPLLVVRGAHSRILTADSAARTAALVEGRVVEIPDSGHGLCTDNPAAVAAALADFLLPGAAQAGDRSRRR